MGGSPIKVIKKTITKALGGSSSAAPAATSAIQDRREEVIKETAPKAKKLVGRRIRRNRRRRSNLAGFIEPVTAEALGTGVRNPTGTGKTKLGA